MKRVVAVAVAGAVLVGVAFYVVTTMSTDAGKVILRHNDRETVVSGAGIYQANCATCHGANLEGQPNWRVPDGAGMLPAPPHDVTGHTWHHDGDTLFRLTKYGVAELIGDPDHATNMPAYEVILSDAEIIAVLSYIKSTWPAEIRARHDSLENR